MTKTALTLLLSIAILQIATAQQSVGFSDSTDFQYIIDYRLPDWGYSNLYISTDGFNYQGNYGRSDRINYNPGDTTYIDHESSNNDINFHVFPAYQLYKQSEERVISFDTEIRIGTEFYKGKSSTGGSSTNEEIEVVGQKQNINRKETSISYSNNLDYKKYLDSNFFISTGGETYINFSSLHSESVSSQGNLSSTDIKLDSYNRNLRIRPTIGIGFGQLRNVSPQLRSLRLQERYHSITDDTFTSAEIVETAEQFTKIRGYQRTYDRYRKYFWGDMSDILSAKLDGFDAYDLMYLTDVLNENLGQRLEGFETSISGEYSFMSNLEKTESFQNDRNEKDRVFNKQKSVLTNATIRWFRNLNLKHQLSFAFNNSVDFPLEKRNYARWRLSSYADFSWLYTMTDRYLLTTSLRNYYDTQDYKDRFSRSEQFRNQTYLSSSLSYFIENSLSVTGSISTGYTTRKNEQPNSDFNSSGFGWDFSISI